MSGIRVTYVPRTDSTAEAEVAALGNVYAYLIKVHASKKPAEHTPESDGRNYAAIVRNTEEVSYVEQRLDRPSQIVVTYSRKSRNQ